MNRWAGWFPLALLLGAFALRVYAVGQPALRGDEAFSVNVAAQPVSTIVDTALHVDPNPPLYLLLLKGWLALAGSSELAARWPSVLSGTVALALLYRLGRAWTHPRIALWALGLAAFSPFLVWHAQDARAYALWLALTLAAAWATWQAAQPRALQRTWWLAGGLWWLALFTHYLTVLLLAAVGLALLLAPRTRQHWRPALIMAAGVGLAFLPWAVTVAPFLAGHTKSWIAPINGLEMAGRTLAAFSVGVRSAGGEGWLAWVGGGLLLGLLVLGSIDLARREVNVAVWLLAVAAGMPVGLGLISLARPIFTEQYALPSLPGLLLMAAVGLQVLDGWQGWGPLVRRLALVGLSGVALLSLQNYFFNPAYAKSPDWSMVMQYLDETARPNEVVILNLPDPGFFHYYQGSMPVVASPPDALTVVGLPATEAQLADLRDRYHHLRFFFSPSPLYDPDGFVGQWLDNCCEKTEDEFVGRFRVQTFDTPTGSLAARAAYSVEFESGITLTGYRVTSASLKAGQTAHLTLYWRARTPITASYTIFVHLLAADGFNVANADSLPAAGRQPTDQWAVGLDVMDPHPIPLSPDMPPGEYGLEIGVYELSTGQRLWGIEPSGARVDAVQLPIRLSVESR